MLRKYLVGLNGLQCTKLYSLILIVHWRPFWTIRRNSLCDLCLLMCKNRLNNTGHSLTNIPVIEIALFWDTITRVVVYAICRYTPYNHFKRSWVWISCKNMGCSTDNTVLAAAVVATHRRQYNVGGCATVSGVKMVLMLPCLQYCTVQMNRYAYMSLFLECSLFDMDDGWWWCSG